MCGRFTLFHSAADVAEQFGLDALPSIEPRFNIAPTQPVLAVRGLPEGGRQAVLLRWGLVPSWAADLSIGNRLLNARAETVVEKPSFRAAFQRRRCLIVADGFYEWQTAARQKKPIHFRFADGRLFAFAGLWERWAAPGGSIVESCTILTTSANALIRPIHERMPVILDPRGSEEWLGSRTSDTAVLRSWLTAWPAEEMMAVAANPRVNNPRNEGQACLQGA
jgi:putative SOS response-associated peptidase YedK